MHRFSCYLLFFVVLLATSPGSARAQGAIEGTVTAAGEGTPLVGANVVIQELNQGGAVDADGRYVISDVPAGTHVVEAHYVGYQPQAQPVTVARGDTVTVRFTLSRTAMNLDEVVVTGTGGPVEKRKLGNAIGTISPAEIEAAPAQNVSDLLQGREPSLVGLASSGTVGEGSRIRIRGSASLSQSNEPMVLIDGVRVDRGGGFGGFVGAGGAGSPSRLDDINPDAIERIEVLKGAAAATLYGTEASNGVIQVFTKDGAVHEPRFRFQAKLGGLRYPKTVPANTGFASDVYDSAGNLTLSKEQVADSMSTYLQRSVQPYELVSRNYVHQLYETGLSQEYSASASGGSEGITYYLSGRWTGADGPMTGTAFPFPEGTHSRAEDATRKAQASANINIFPMERLQLRVNSNFTDSHFETFQTGNNTQGVISGAMHSKPELVRHSNPSGASYVSTVQERLQQTVAQDVRHFNGSVGANYRPLDPVILDGTFGVDYTSQFSEEVRPYGWNINDYASTEVEGARRTSERSYLALTTDLQATLEHELSAVFSSTFIAGVQGFLTEEVVRGGRARNFPGPGFGVTEAASDNRLSELYVEEAEMGVFAQEQIGYRDYLFMTLGGRYDAHSAFGSDFSGIFYPKLSFSAVLSDAPFWGGVGPLSSLRLRGALGQSGLQPGAFDALTTFGAAVSATGAGLVPENLGNPALKPEVATELEAGAELGFFEDRLALEATYWDRTVRDALVARGFAPSGGFVQPQLENIGRLDGRGLELSLNAQVVSRENTTVRLFANTAYLWEQVTSLGAAPPFKVGGTYPRYRQFIKEGYAPGAHFGAKLLEVPAGHYPISRRGLLEVLGRDYQNVDPRAPAPRQLVLDYLETLTPRTARLSALNDYVLRTDADGDGDMLDHYLGKPMPDWQGAFGGSVTWKAFTLHTLFEYRAGNYFINNLTSGFRTRSAGIGRNTPASARTERDYVTGGVDENYAAQNDPEVRLEAAEAWLGEHLALAPFSGLNQIQPGDFVRLREVSLTYDLPTGWVQRLPVRDLSVTLAGRNLWLATRYSGPDPEVNAIGRSGGDNNLENNFLLGTDAWNLPLPRRLALSVTVGL